MAPAVVPRYQSSNSDRRSLQAPRFSMSSSQVASRSLVRRDRDRDNDETGYINYYYVFIALFVVVLLLLLWAGRKQQQRKKAMMQTRRQSALAQDSSGWPNTRRWMHGTWRSEPTNAQPRYEEGYNHRGEAPPPYMRNDPTSQVVDPTAPPPPLAGTAEDPALTRPEAALTRGHSTHKPPEYDEAVSPAASVATTPISANVQSSTSPGAAETANDLAVSAHAQSSQSHNSTDR